jgi:hypothetical protein
VYHVWLSNVAELKGRVTMKSSLLTVRSWALTSAFIFGMASMGIVQAKECDMPDSVAAGDSAAVRADCPDQKNDQTISQELGLAREKQKPSSTMGPATAKPDNSRFSTDGTERYDQYDNDRGYNGTGPRREGRY